MGMKFVWMREGYWVGKYEVTQEEYEKVMDTSPSRFKGPRKPVEMVNWHDAVEFCKKLTAMEKKAGKLPVGYIYNLPTEIQWMQFVGNAQWSDAVTSREHRRSSTENVGSLRPNKLGIYDTYGNVWEWCLDKTDIGRMHDLRVIRGAAWSKETPYPVEETYVQYLETSDRFAWDPGGKSPYYGFRAVLVPVESAQ